VIAPAASEPRRPFVVLVSLDTLRARSMSAYGYGLGTTPEFQRIAAEGALFENAFTTFSNTLAAHMSMLTGLYPAAHGVYTNTRLSAAIPTLAENLRGAGYQTAAITEDGLITARAGFARGFAHYVEDKTTAWHEVGARRTFERALAWANAHADEPFFLFVHTYAVHAPTHRGPPTGISSRRRRRRAPIGSYEQEVRGSTTTSPGSSAGSTACSDGIATSSSSPPTTARSSASTGSCSTSSSTTRSCTCRCCFADPAGSRPAG
jgi:hypothetical protein